MKSAISVGSNILLVDDDQEILESTMDGLSPKFERVYLASSARKAIEILQNNKIDLVVTDYAMPEMDGLSLIKFIKSNYPIIPVILLTGNTESPEVILGLESGVFDIVEKPFRIQVLSNRIENGLLVPELVKTTWKFISSDISLPRMEEFLRLSIQKQNQIMFAYSRFKKMKSLIKGETAKLTKQRGKIRFDTEKNEISFVSFVSFDLFEYKNEVSVLVLNESPHGACFIINQKMIPSSFELMAGSTIFLKIGNLDPIKSVICWFQLLDKDIAKIGIHHPLV